MCSWKIKQFVWTKWTYIPPFVSSVPSPGNGLSSFHEYTSHRNFIIWKRFFRLPDGDHQQSVIHTLRLRYGRSPWSELLASMLNQSDLVLPVECMSIDFQDVALSFPRLFLRNRKQWTYGHCCNLYWTEFSLFSSGLMIDSAVFRSETNEYGDGEVNVVSSQRNDRLL